MSNKVRGKLDFRNVKNTQFDAAQTAKMEFSELYSSKRVLPTNTILRDGYTHFKQELDANSRPTKVTYYQATDSTIDRLQFVADSGSSLAGNYYVITSQIDGKTYAIYQVVSGSGSAPGVADVEIAATFNSNDPASLVSFANKLALDQIPDITVLTQSPLSSFRDIEYLQFGEGDVIDVSSSGFTVTRTKPGDSFVVGEVELEYLSNGDIVWQDEILKGSVFDVYSASFKSATKITDGENQLEINSDGSINVEIGGNYELTNVYNEVSSLASNIQQDIISYTAPISNTETYLSRIFFSGTNIADYLVQINGSTVDRKRTYFSGSLNDVFDFSANSRGILLSGGDVVTVKVEHNRPEVGDFNARIEKIEIP